jgi:hypothetical protein
MRKLFALVILGLSSLPLLAQEGLPKIEVFGGYQYLHIGGNSSSYFSDSQGFNGWNASAAYRLYKYLGVEGDFSGVYASPEGVSTHIYTYTGGPLVSAGIGPIQPFAHALFGGVRLTPSANDVSVTWNGFTAMAGGGVDAKVLPRISLRVIQFDWVYYHFGSKNFFGQNFPSFSGSNNVRISTGVVLRL